ncbi:MAG: HTH domain-containing protein [Candidatus Omnitrophica bacterium]|jgi:predicted transcriptional regulator|nr:HTH domain-containing protein [Candidatus Omnitrophota bacterium]
MNMGQQEVIQYLIKQKRPVEIKEMSENLNITRSNISHSCNKLKKEKAIIIKPTKIGCFIKYMIYINPRYLRR